MEQGSYKYFIGEGGFGNCDRNEWFFCSSETKSYYLLSFDGINKIISMDPYDHLEPEKLE